jgi:bisphosphoglycerate-dependent phosphoglycerate mutase
MMLPIVRELWRAPLFSQLPLADAALSEKGHEEAKGAGKLLKEAGFTFDVAFVSVLKRAVVTLW